MPKISKRLGAALVGVLATALVASPLLVAAPAQAMKAPEDRGSVAPNVFFPAAARKAHDLKTSGKRPGTEIKAKCGSKVVAATPGYAIVSSSPKSGPGWSAATHS